MPPRGTLKSKSAPAQGAGSADARLAQANANQANRTMRMRVLLRKQRAAHRLAVRAWRSEECYSCTSLPWPASGQAPLQLRGARAQLLARAFPCFRARHALVEGLPRCRGVAPVAAARGQQEPCFLSCCHPSRFLSFKVCRGPLAGGASARGTPLPPRWGATAMSTPPARACAAARP